MPESPSHHGCYLCELESQPRGVDGVAHNEVWSCRVAISACRAEIVFNF